MSIYVLMYGPTHTKRGVKQNLIGIFLKETIGSLTNDNLFATLFCMKIKDSSYERYRGNWVMLGMGRTATM